ncbi:hypothetical protein SAMN04488118_11710 [Epibacterium ulvae]|uniref:Uncharacterized protein n=1 Tax=Epibacterium ulvae TaxID=1156985 RepID=A0A1G5RH58_9RHOB|nr:hypothetical protein [Epibacterium ulvae]SCZ73367.1 hypothetical protein SAMN04488118_11710 [Epibacterium ulvae]
MAISLPEKIAIYRRNLVRYEQEGDAEKVEVQRRLIARLENELASRKGAQGAKTAGYSSY